jgi:hypothetical protein
MYPVIQQQTQQKFAIKSLPRNLKIHQPNPSSFHTHLCGATAFLPVGKGGLAAIGAVRHSVDS